MSNRDNALGGLTKELVGIGGPLASIVSHMLESAQVRGHDPSGIPKILGDLLEPTLAGLADDWETDRIDDAAAVLHAACERICAEILLVPAPNRAQRRRRPL